MVCQADKGVCPSPVMTYFTVSVKLSDARVPDVAVMVTVPAFDPVV